jgi:hypothetical protein
MNVVHEFLICVVVFVANRAPSVLAREGGVFGTDKCNVNE